MDRALWLLLQLRLKAWLRRLGRSAATVRGALLVVLGLALFLAWLVPALILSPQDHDNLEEVRRYGPWALVAYFLANLLFSTGENALTFTAAEVNLLFPAPLSRRQLLLYKIWGVAFSSVFSGLFFTIFLRRYATLVVAAIVGLTLMMVMFQLFAMLLALLASVLGKQAYNRRRKLLLALVLTLLAIFAYRLVGTALAGDWRTVVDEMDRSPVMQILLAPANWFVLAFTAERIWPDLVQWAALALAVNGVLLLLVFALDAHFLETSAAASERHYARLQRLRRGGPAMIGLSANTLRLTAPRVSYLGGIGPIFWRQATTFLRSRGSLLMILLLTAVMSAPLAVQAAESRGPEQSLPSLGGMLLMLTLVVPTLLPLDFRGDVDRMDLLKVLPLPAWRLVVGQLLTPVIVISLVQMTLVLLAQGFWGRLEPWLQALLAFLPPINFLLFAIENLMFLWFPSRLTPAAPGDFQVLGRQLLLWMVKMVGLLTMLGLAVAAGVGVWWVTGENWLAGGMAAWVMCAALAGAAVPLVADAFRRFDVARDTPA